MCNEILQLFLSPGRQSQPLKYTPTNAPAPQTFVPQKNQEEHEEKAPQNSSVNYSDTPTFGRERKRQRITLDSWWRHLSF